MTYLNSAAKVQRSTSSSKEALEMIPSYLLNTRLDRSLEVTVSIKFVLPSCGIRKAL